MQIKKKAPVRKNKFGNQPVTVDGHRFHSKREAQRYSDLLWLQKANQIADLKLQPRFELVVNDICVGHYVADFRYVLTASGEEVIEDVKSPVSITPVYKLKKKILAAQIPPVKITEIF